MLTTTDRTTNRLRFLASQWEEQATEYYDIAKTLPASKRAVWIADANARKDCARALREIIGRGD